MLMFKTAQGGGEVHWHQDATFLRCEPFPSLAFDWLNRRPSPTDACTWSRVPQGAVDGRFGLDQNGQPGCSRPAYDVPPEGNSAHRSCQACGHSRTPAHASFPNFPVARLAFTLHLMDARSQYAHDNWLQLAADESWSTLQSSKQRPTY